LSQQSRHQLVGRLQRRQDDHDVQVDSCRSQGTAVLTPLVVQGPAQVPVGHRVVAPGIRDRKGTGTVQIGPDKQQLIGVKYGQAEVGNVSRTIRAAGKVVFDETRIEHVHTKVEGWIDKVFVNFTGKQVEKGQPLLTIYSPEMLASQQEFLLAAKAQDMMRDNTFEAALDQSKSLLNASRRRLQLWDLSDAQIDRILKTGEPIRNVTLYSPVTGYVVDRKAFPQIKVTPDTDLYTVVDLNRVWILADVFEYEAPSIQVGDAARVSLSYLPGKTLMARIDYIQPQVDPMTRTLKVRLNMENPGMFLKPDMYVDVEFRIDLPAKLTVPADAVLDAGERQTVFVDRGNGFFEPRQVQTGGREGDRIVILRGLKSGERVVTSGNFLIDSESQMKAAAAGLGGMAGHQHGAGATPPKESFPPAPTAGHEQHGAGKPPVTAQPPAMSEHKHD